MRNLTDEFILKYKNNEVIFAKCGSKLVGEKKKATKMETGGSVAGNNFAPITGWQPPVTPTKAPAIAAVKTSAPTKRAVIMKKTPPAATILTPTNTAPVNQGYPGRLLMNSYTRRMTAPGVLPAFSYDKGRDTYYSGDKKGLIPADKGAMYGLSPAEIAQLQAYHNSK